MRIGDKQLALMRAMGATHAVIVSDKMTDSLVRRGLMREAVPGGTVFVTAAGLRAVADALDAGRLQYAFPKEQTA